MGGVGDVYYCEEKISLEIKDHNLKKYKPAKFKFKWGEKGIKFGSEENFFKDYEENFNDQSSKNEMFAIQNYAGKTTIKYNNGVFLYVSMPAIDFKSDMINVVTATCTKF